MALQPLEAAGLLAVHLAAHPHAGVLGPGGSLINKQTLELGYYVYKDPTSGGHQRANSQSVSIPAGV